MLGTEDDLHLREMFSQAVHDRLGICIHHHCFYFRDSQKRFEDVMKKRLARKRTIIFTGHALAVMTHRNKGGEFHAPILSYNVKAICHCEISARFIPTPLKTAAISSK